MDEITVPLGNIDLLSKSKTGFLVSRNAPPECINKINAWVDSLSPDDDCVLIGNLQRLENNVLNRLLERNIPAVLVLSGPFPDMWPTNIVRAVGDGKLLVLTIADFELPWVDKYGRAYERNRYIIANADNVVVGYLHPGGTVAKQIDGFNNVTFLT